MNRPGAGSNGRDQARLCAAGSGSVSHTPSAVHATYWRVLPDNVDALTLLGISLTAQERHAESARVFPSSRERQPKVASHWTNLGTVLRSERRWDEALQCLSASGGPGRSLRRLQAQSRPAAHRAWRSRGRESRAAAKHTDWRHAMPRSPTTTRTRCYQLMRARRRCSGAGELAVVRRSTHRRRREDRGAAHEARDVKAGAGRTGPRAGRPRARRGDACAARARARTHSIASRRRGHIWMCC